MKRFDNDVALMKKEWEELKNALQSGKVDPFNIDEIKEYDFFEWFHQMIKYVKPEIEVHYEEIKNIYRAVHHESLEEHEHDRLIPKKEHAVINKMTPKNRLFLYLGYHEDSENEDLIKHTCAKEIRAEEGDVVSVAKFEMKDHDKKIVDLTKTNIPIEENRFVTYVNNEFERAGKQAMRVALIKVAFEMFTLDGTFKPMEGEEDHELEYAPFHALANLFEYEGFDGMIYRSMVVNEGKNIVLFNHEDAHAIPKTIHQHEVKKEVNV